MRFDVELFVLRLVAVDGGEFMRGGLVTYTAELHDSRAPLPPLKPAPAGLPLDDEPQRAAWARPGGIAATVAWADDVLEARGTPRAAPVVQTKAWNLSSVLRVPTRGGGVWCKSVPPLLAHQGRSWRGWRVRGPAWCRACSRPTRHAGRCCSPTSGRDEPFHARDVPDHLRRALAAARA